MSKAFKPLALAAGAVIVAVAGWSQAQQGTGAPGTAGPGGRSGTNPVEQQTPGSTPSVTQDPATQSPAAGTTTPSTTTPSSTMDPGTTTTPGAPAADTTTSPGSTDSTGSGSGSLGARADRN